jgi:hypothetical protein
LTATYILHLLENSLEKVEKTEKTPLKKLRKSKKVPWKN